MHILDSLDNEDFYEHVRAQLQIDQDTTVSKKYSCYDDKLCFLQTGHF